MTVLARIAVSKSATGASREIPSLLLRIWARGGSKAWHGAAMLISRVRWAFAPSLR